MGFSDSEIARRTGFHRSTICREFRRNCDEEEISYQQYVEMKEEFQDEEIDPPPAPRDRWNAEFASKNRNLRLWKANQIRRRKDKKTIQWAIQKLKIGWTPEQIAGRSKIDGPNPISHECIYEYIKRDRKAHGRLFTLLKRFRKRKQRNGYRSYAGHLPNRVFIDTRPKVVEKRIRLGDIEADLICGYKARGYLLTLVDRASRRTILKKLKTKSKTEVYFAICYALEEFIILRTLTVDNGKEFALHEKISKSKNLKVYFTHPYTSQEKGTVENTNGLIRRHLPKGTDLSKVSEKKIKNIENLLNNCPRKVLNYLTPMEVHRKKILEEKRL